MDPRYKLLYQHADENVITEWVEEAWEEMQGAQDVVDSDSDDVPIVKAPASTGFISIDDCFKDVAFMRTGRKQSEKRSEAERELIDIEVENNIKVCNYSRNRQLFVSASFRKYRLSVFVVE